MQQSGPNVTPLPIVERLADGWLVVMAAVGVTMMIMTGGDSPCIVVLGVSQLWFAAGFVAVPTRESFEPDCVSAIIVVMTKSPPGMIPATWKEMNIIGVPSP